MKTDSEELNQVLDYEMNRFNEEIVALLKFLDTAPERIARETHEQHIRMLNEKAELIKASVVGEIRQMFKAAFPNRYYTFLVKRPRDTDPWPVVFSDGERAHNYQDRFGPVVEVLL